MSTFGKSMVLFGTALLGFGIGLGVTQLRAEEVTPKVIANIGQVVQADGMLILGEKSFDTLDECWEYVSEFNSEGNAQGFIAFCWPSYVTATPENLVQS